MSIKTRMGWEIVAVVIRKEFGKNYLGEGKHE